MPLTVLPPRRLRRVGSDAPALLDAFDDEHAVSVRPAPVPTATAPPARRRKPRRLVLPIPSSMSVTASGARFRVARSIRLATGAVAHAARVRSGFQPGELEQQPVQPS